MLHLSYSSVETYQHCPLSYKFKYHDRLPEKPRGEFTLGNALHSALEFFYRGVEPPSLDELLEKYSSSWVSAGFRTREEEKTMFTLGAGWLKEFYLRFSGAYKKPIHVEYRFELEVEDFLLIGAIDRIDRLPDGNVEIIDYKSGDVARSDLDFNLQLGIYQLAVEKALGLNVERLTIFHIPTLTPFSSPPLTGEKLSEILKKISSVAAGIRKKRFGPVRNEWCPCDHASLCPYYRHLYAIMHPEGRPVDMCKVCNLVDRYAEWALNRKPLDNPDAISAEIRRFIHSYDLRRVYGMRYALEPRGNAFHVEEITPAEREGIM
jgi:RecB family exonuclease